MTAAGQDRLTSWLAQLLQTTDSFYPTGTYAHSFGVEGLAQMGVITDLASLRRFLLDFVMPPLARTDMAVAAHAWAAAAQPIAWERVGHLCHLGAALRGTREIREACEAIGRQRVEIAARLHGGLAADFLDRVKAETWPCPASVAAAIEGQTLGIPRDAVLAGIAYSAAAAVVSAAVKLLRLGQNAVHALLAQALAHAGNLVETAVCTPIEEIGAFNPWWDVASARHEHADFRLFIS